MKDPAQTHDPDAQAGPSAGPAAPENPQPAPSVRLPGPLRVALVGAGFIADYHLDVLRETEGVEVLALCDTNLARARALADKYDVAHAFTEIDKLVEVGIEVAHVLVPPDLHVDVVRQLLERDIAVFVEKPLALHSDDARELTALAAERGVALGVNHNNLFHPAFSKLMERVRAGKIGRVEHAQVTLSVPLMQLDAHDYAHWMFRAPRNIVFEQAVHPLCQVHELIGRVKSTQTTLLSTRELHPKQVFHDRWSISAEGERGTAQVFLSFGGGFTRSTVQVIGSDGSLEADLFHDTLSGERKTAWLDFWNSFLADARRAWAYGWSGARVLVNWMRFTLGLGRRKDAFYVGMRDSVGAFYAALERHTPAPVGGESAAQVLEWCEAVADGLPGEGLPTPELPRPGAARENEVVVIGGSGFIGKRVVTKLLGAGLPVTCVVRRTHGLPPEIVEPALDGRVRVFRGSLEETLSLQEAFAGARTVLHLATGGGDTWEEVERSMVRGTVAVAGAALENEVHRVVFVSSIAALYTGSDHGGPLEDSLDTDPQPEKRALYARGKIEAERALVELHRDHGLPVVIVRPGVVVGHGTPMQHSGYGLWARDNHCVGWGSGRHPLPLVWVDDVADALVRVTKHRGQPLEGRALNLCTSVQLSGREAVQQLKLATGRDLHFHARPLLVSQGMEIGKWLVKVAGRKRAEFPSWRDLKARSLARPFTSRTAREVLNWEPIEEREAFIAKAIGIYAPRRP